MLEMAWFQGILNLADIAVIGAMMVGIVLGIIIAVTPQGLGSILMYALLLPVIIRWEPIVAIGLLISMLSSNCTCSSFLPVLLGIPGGASGQAAVLDGFPMGQRGEARRALGAAFSAAMLGSVVGTATLALAIPLVRPLVMWMGSPELLVVVIWGLTMVAVMTGRSAIKGLIATCFGLLLATVGMHAITGQMRYTFGITYLWDGLSISLVALSMFGIPAALDLFIVKSGVERQAPPLTGRLIDGVRDTLRNWWLVVRCSFVGIWVGIVPGLGAHVVDWMAYGHAGQTCKGAKETFGKGDVRGLIAPESAANARDGGTLLPTLVLGVPGCVLAALFLFALLALGLPAGPELMKKHADIVYSIVWILGLCSIVGGMISFLLVGPLSKIALLRYSFLVAIILSFTMIGSFATSRSIADLWVMVLFGLLAYFMKRYRYSRPALILGLVLGGPMEKYLYISSIRYGYKFLLMPSVMVLGIIVLGILGITLWTRREKEPKTQSPPQSLPSGVDSFKFRPAVLLSLFFLAAFSITMTMSWNWIFQAKALPITIAIPGIVLALVQVYLDLIGREEDTSSGFEADELLLGVDLPKNVEIGRTLSFGMWVIGCVVAIWLIGILYGVTLFITLFTLVQGREKWWICLLMGGGAYLFMWGIFEHLFKIALPPGILF